MKSLWIESHVTLGGHPKTRRFARHLKVSIPTAAGHLHLLWHWAIQYEPDGLLGHHDPEDIAAGAHFEGDPADFLAALVAAGYANDGGDGLRLHDWWNYAGRFVAARQASADAGSFGNHQRWHSSRGIINPACPHCAGESGGDRGAISGAESGPNRTKPNLTQPSPPPTADGDEIRTSLTNEGFPSDAIEHAIKTLNDNGDRITSKLAYARKVAKGYSTEKAEKDRARAEAELIAACDRCNDNGHVEIEREDGSLELAHCDHSATKT